MDANNNPWQILTEKEIYDNPWINVKEFDVINPGGGKGIYGKVHLTMLKSIHLLELVMVTGN